MMQPRQRAQTAIFLLGMLGLWELVARVGSDPADRPTTDPMQKQLGEPLKHARELGYLPNSDISGLVDRTLRTEIQPER